MSYKTILVHVDESNRASERIKIAAAIAMTQSAHLIGTAMTGASRYLVQTMMLADTNPNLRPHLDFLRKRAERGLDDFENCVRRLGLPSFEKRLVDDEAGAGVCLQARYADLVVIGQNDPNELSPVVMPDFPQYVVLNSGRPVLLVPYAGQFDNIGNRVLVAWDASMAATRAVAGAIPLLRRAQVINVAVFNPQLQPQAHGAHPGADLAEYLARHGIKIDISQQQTDQEIGDALLSLAADKGVDLIIMGGYGHARFREILLGGATRTVLETMTVPVLMSH
ncbi:MAG TPA: universal stress protein [Noviherbaspirillum sp.]|uniref:universal stress protein n=1 Tax=Noviherbaspirillum sp. TaxID=1926288 RepID=UPI002B472A50|nr:universal stress protein [Noviherbaspirillum sp.]HJV86347.1 universal stress protein [Noviherbaspirillum sp.]